MNDLSVILKFANRLLPGNIRSVNANLDHEKFEQLVRDSPLAVVPSADGAIAAVYEAGDPSDHSHQTASFDLHKDGLYHARLPDFVLLYCAQPGRGDNPTVVVDTRPVVERIEKIPELRVLKHVELVYRGKDGEEHARSLVDRHPLTGWPVLNLGARTYLRPLPALPAGATPTLREVSTAMTEVFRLLDGCLIKRHFWREGDLLFIDNHTFLHGREARRPDWQRKLFRVWLSVPTKERPA